MPISKYQIKNWHYEQSLATQVEQSGAIRTAMLSAFHKMHTLVAVDLVNGRDYLSEIGRYAWTYSKWFSMKHGVRRTVRKEIGHIHKKIAGHNISYPTGMFWAMIAAYADAAYIYHKDCRWPMGDIQDAYGMRGEAEQMRFDGRGDEEQKLSKSQRHAARKEANPVYFPNQKDASRRFNEKMGPSFTVLVMLRFADVCAGCTQDELRALGWGLFAWWRKHTRFGDIHTFQEVMYIVNDYVGDRQFTEYPDSPSLNRPGGPEFTSVWSDRAHVNILPPKPVAPKPTLEQLLGRGKPAKRPAPVLAPTRQISQFVGDIDIDELDIDDIDLENFERHRPRAPSMDGGDMDIDDIDVDLL